MYRFVRRIKWSRRVTFVVIKYGIVKQGSEEWRMRIWLTCIKVVLRKVQNLLILKRLEFTVRACLRLALLELRYYMRKKEWKWVGIEERWRKEE